MVRRPTTRRRVAVCCAVVVVATAAVALVVAPGSTVGRDTVVAPPTTTIEQPASGVTTEGDLVLSGWARAEAGIRHVELTLRNLDTRQYWNGSSWQASWIRYPVVISGAPTESAWSETVSAPDLRQGTYYARAWTRAVDGNGDPVGDTEVTFSWDDGTAPAVEDTATDATLSAADAGPAADADTGLDPSISSDAAGTLAFRDETATVVFRDDFDTFDDAVWTPEHSTYGDGNDELQCYHPGNVTVADGKLVLRAVKETYTCPNGSTRQYTSGMVRTQGVTLLPGQAIEFRVKLTPADDRDQGGLWPAVWASGWGGGGWPTGGEMDWLEVMTAVDPTRSVHTIHFGNTDGDHAKVGRDVVGDDYFSDDWHTVRFDYGTGGDLRWFLDGTEVHRVTTAPTAQGWPAPFDEAVTEIKINLALGGTPGPLSDAALGSGGATFEVDYLQIVDLN